MTVGLGGKDQDKIDSLAHGMLDTIVEGNFDYVVLFGSEQSKSTIKSLKRQYIEKFNDNPNDENLNEFDYYEFVQNDDVNDFNQYYETIRSKILELEDDYIIKINYTPGTKTMSISAAIASLVFRKKLRLIDGDRGNGTTVIKGTEKHVDFGLYIVYDEVLIKRIRKYFNYNHFASGKLLINDLTSENHDKQDYDDLFNAYLNWDNVNFEEALKYLSGLNSKFPELSAQLSLNLTALNIINREVPIKKDGVVIDYKPHDEQCYYKLASIINNAERRFDEKRYDDAIARLYRSLELISQIKLNEYGIKTDDVDINILLKHDVSEDFISRLKNKIDNKGIIKSALVSNYQMLYELNDDLGVYFNTNKSKFIGQLESRNKSIFAHGLESKTKEDYLKFKKTVLEVANILHENMDKYLNETKFPKFNI